MNSPNNEFLQKDIASKMALKIKDSNFIEINKKVSEDTKTLINYVF